MNNDPNNLKKYYYFEVSNHNSKKSGILYGDFDILTNRLSGELLLYSSSPYVYLIKTAVTPYICMEIETHNLKEFKSVLHSTSVGLHDQSLPGDLSRAGRIFDNIEKGLPPEKE